MSNDLSLFLQQLLSGLTQGCVYALIALGYTLVFGVLRVIFFAQGELCMIGAFGAAAAIGLVGDANGPIRLAAAAVGAVTAAVLTGVLAHQLTIRPLEGAPRTKQLVATLGVSLLLQNLVMLGVSSEAVAIAPILPDTAWTLLGARLGAGQLAILLLTPCVLLVSYLFLFRSRLGLRIRAVAENPWLARVEGIPVRRAALAAFVFSSAVAGVAGMLMASYDGVVKFDMGFMPGIKGFTAAVLGGFGNPLGAMVGGLALGLVEGLTAGYVSSAYRDVIAFVVLVGVLVVRPKGLMPAYGET